MSIKHDIRKFLWNFNYDITRYKSASHPLARRNQILKSCGIDVVLDVGANVGSYGLELREIGYANKIISFEPLTSAYERLSISAGKDINWKALHFALGDEDERHEINISKNSYSSSLLKILPSHVKSAPESDYIGKELIAIKRLDNIFNDLEVQNKSIYMKIDTQGFEDRVLKGGINSLEKIDVIQMEMSLVPLYDGAKLFDEMLCTMSDYGYSLYAIETGFSDSISGQMLQFDGIFRRK